jgi:hypothetical protein
MQPDELIEKFIKVIQNQDYLFNQVPIHDIASLQTNLKALENLNSESLAAVISNWYSEHDSVRDVRNAVLRNERITEVRESNRGDRDTFITNRDRIITINKELEKKLDKNKDK